MSRGHATTKPVLVTENCVIVKATGGKRIVVTDKVFEAVGTRLLLFAVTMTLYVLFAFRLEKLAEVGVKDEGVEGSPFRVYV